MGASGREEGEAREHQQGNTSEKRRTGAMAKGDGNLERMD